MNPNEKKFLEFRNTFPAYNQGIYINHAAISPFSQIVKETLLDYWEKRSHLPVDVYWTLLETKKEFKQMICRMINADTPDEIALVTNTSIGLNIIASGLSWQKDDRIILNTVEFPSNIYPFMNLERLGVQLDWVTPHNGEIRPEDIETKITPKTKLIAISFVQFLNGFKADLKRIGTICQKNNIWFIVDGIQGVGAIPIDVHECHIDGLSTAGHKWLMWPMGTGFLYTSPKLLNELTPTYAGWLSVKNSWDFFDYKLDFLDSAEKFEPGTINFMGMVVGHAILKKFLELSIPDIYNRILYLTNILRNNLNELNIDVISPSNPDTHSGIVSIKVQDPKKLHDQLTEANILCAIREGIIRFSPHCTNTEEDIHHLISFLKKYFKR